MLKTEQLQQYLLQYQSLALHQDENLKSMTLLVMAWQKQRMQQLHSNIFTQSHHQLMNHFFFSHFYHFDALELLAQQLEHALAEKIKLDRWLPNEVLETILNGFKLALLTLEADIKLATLLLEKNLTANEVHILSILPEAEQFSLRLEQLDLLQKVSSKLFKFAHSFLLRSALKLAQPKIEQRGFLELHRYIEDGIKAMRSNKKSLSFFKQLVHQEKLFLDYLHAHHPTHLDVYYDAKTDRIAVLPQPNTDACSN